MYVSMCRCVYMCVCVCMCVYVCVYVCMCVYVCVFALHVLRYISKVDHDVSEISTIPRHSNALKYAEQSASQTSRPIR